MTRPVDHTQTIDCEAQTAQDSASADNCRRCAGCRNGRRYNMSKQPKTTPNPRLSLAIVLTACTFFLATAVTAQASSSYVQVGEIAGFGFPVGGVAGDRSSGDLYVVDGSGAVVNKYGPTGTLISSFGGPGSGNGQFGQGFFSGPAGVAVDQSNGDVYVVDRANSRVEKFDSAGVYLTQFNGSATPAGSFSSPTSVAVDPINGGVYVVDAGNNVIDKFDSSGNLVTAFGSGGALSGSATPASSFAFPITSGEPLPGMAVDSSGRLYVGDVGNGVVDEFNSSGEYQGHLGAGTLSAPSELAVDSSDDVFAADSSTQSIVKFDSAGDQLVSFPTNGTRTLRGLAVAGDGANVYASLLPSSFLETSPVLIFAMVTLPDVTTATPSNVQQTTATVEGTVNPDGVPLTDCHFVYTDDADFQANGYSGPDAKTAACVPDAAAIPSDHSDHSVASDLTGLSPNTTYHVRLVAANAQGSAHGQDRTLTTPGPPVIDGTSFTGVGLTQAILKAQVNPEGSHTVFHFEYGTTTAYGNSAPVPDSDLGMSTTDQLASTDISGLSPITTYHFRLVAHNEQGVTQGPDDTFTTFAPPQSRLPDSRAYELVTPTDKNGQSIPIAVGTLRSALAADGGHVLYFAQAPFGEHAINGLEGVFEATRSPGGWQSTSVAFPQADPQANFDNEIAPSAFTPDFSSIYYEEKAIDRNTSAPIRRVVYVHNSDGTFVNLSQNADGEAALAGSSADGSHVLLEMGQVTSNSLIPGQENDVGGVMSLFDHTRGQNLPVSVGTNGAPISSCGAGLAGAVGGSGLDRYSGYHDLEHFREDVSTDGARIFFQVPDPQGKAFSPDPNCLATPELYVREGDAQTIEISVSQKTGSAGAQAAGGATFMGATPDGSKVFFYTPDQLTDDPAAASGGLYRFDVLRRTLTFIVKAPEATSRAVVVGGDEADGTTPLVSVDGSHVYFRGSVPGNGPVGTNIYLWNEGQIAFVAPDPFETTNQDFLRAVMSADGSTLAIQTRANLTSYDSGGRQEIYLYKQNGGPLTCISCGPNGAAADGDAEFYGDGNLRGEASGAVPVVGFNNITADGSRIVFDSPDRLLAGATNGRYNVYEWEARGAGSCDSTAQDGGCLYLISDGSGPYESHVVGISSDGSDVVFATSDSLVPQDDNNTDDGDLYDARIGGGFPFDPPSAPCSEDQCQGAPAEVPAVPSAASITFNGPGNALFGIPRLTPRITVTRKTITGWMFTLSVKVPGEGRITGTGQALKPVSRAVPKAGTYQLRFILTTNAKRSLAYHKSLSVTVRIVYSPPDATSSSATVSLTLDRRGRTTRKVLRGAHTTWRATKSGASRAWPR
jgi:NHL repeat